MSEEFYRIKRLPPYVIAEVNAMRAAARQLPEYAVTDVAELLKLAARGRHEWLTASPHAAPLNRRLAQWQ